MTDDSPITDPYYDASAHPYASGEPGPPPHPDARFGGENPIAAVLAPDAPLADVTPGRVQIPDGEFAARLDAVQQAMGRHSFAALVVSDPANLYYLTGYDAWSFYTPQCLVVPAVGEPHLFARAMDAAGAHFTCHLPAERIHGYPEHLVHRPDKHPFDWITRTAREVGVLPVGPDVTVAFEGESAFFTARGYLALADGIEGTRLVDSGELVNWVRLVKSPYEVGQLRVAGKIAELAMTTALDYVEVGTRHCDAVAEIMRVQARGTDDHGGDYPAIVPMLPTGPKSGTPHLTWTDAVFAVSEPTTIELAGVFNRYHAPLARTVMLGEPPKRLLAAADVLAEAMPLTLDAMRPGVPAAEVHARFDGILRHHHMAKDSRIGYSIGVGYPPDWGERTVSLRAEETTVMQAGMAFHVILGMWMDGWGYELSEPVVVTETEAVRLCQLPQTLMTKR